MKQGIFKVIIKMQEKERLIMFILKIITLALVFIGALNWGLIGIFGYDLVSSIFGDMSVLSRIVYTLVGISAILLLLTHREIFSKNECICID